jgi:hypothetical protein
MSYPNALKYAPVRRSTRNPELSKAPDLVAELEIYR